MVECHRSSNLKAHHDPRLAQSGGVVAPTAAPPPEDYPELSPELRAIFEKDWLQDERALQALHYLAE